MIGRIVLRVVPSFLLVSFAACNSRNFNTSQTESVTGVSRAAQEKRCGWIDNPTPANWSLIDKDGTWLFSSQGGFRADGLDRLPDFGTRWVKTNGYYGYGCGCLDVKSDVAAHTFTNIFQAQVKDISVCDADAAKNLIPQRIPAAANNQNLTLCGWIDNPTPGNWCH